MLPLQENKAVLNEIKQVAEADISGYEVVSFDVFDTAVLRKTFEPRDIFLLMQEKLVSKQEGKLFGDFANVRESIERRLIQKVRTEHFSNEITLEEIYESLAYYYPEYTNHLTDLMALELETELAYTIQNPLIYQVYERAIQQNKKVIFASDIYLPEHHMQAILAKAGYQQYHKLYVSSELKLNKSSGSLFSHILSELSVSPNKVIHFGDNNWSDCVMANKQGIASVKVPYSAELLEDHRYAPKDVKRNIANSLYKGAVKNYLVDKTEGKPFDLGYEILGPLVYYFTHWLTSHSEKLAIDKLYFIAREGWFLQQVFDQVKTARNINIDSYYLLASRRSLLFPYIERDIEDGFARFLISSTPQKISDCLGSVEVIATQEELEQCGFESADQLILAQRDSEDYAGLIQLLTLVSDRLFSNADEEKRLYSKYLDSINMIGKTPVGVVDSGWFGTGQSILIRFLTDNGFTSMLHGFYLAMHKKAESRQTDRAV